MLMPIFLLQANAQTLRKRIQAVIPRSCTLLLNAHAVYHTSLIRCVHPTSVVSGSAPPHAGDLHHVVYPQVCMVKACPAPQRISSHRRTQHFV